MKLQLHTQVGAFDVNCISYSGSMGFEAVDLGHSYLLGSI